MLDILCACRVVGLNKMRKPLTGFRGPDIILPPVAAQVLLLCKIERRQLSASRLYGFMLRVTGCEGLSAVFFQQLSCGLNLFTRFTARLLLYQASPNWVISRCLYRAAHCHVHTLHSLPVSFWQYIIFFFFFLDYYYSLKARQPCWFGFSKWPEVANTAPLSNLNSCARTIYPECT